MVRAGLRSFPPIEILDDPNMDLTRRSLQLEILRWVESGMLWAVHIGAPCTIWSDARRGITNEHRAAVKEAV
eukprot:12382889-Alexandrium_andersonii.AAC.1